MSNSKFKLDRIPKITENKTLKLLLSEYEKNPTSELKVDILLFVEALLSTRINRADLIHHMESWEKLFGKSYIHNLFYEHPNRVLFTPMDKKDTNLFYNVGDSVLFLKALDEGLGFLNLDFEIEFYNALLTGKKGTVVKEYANSKEYLESESYLVRFEDFNIEAVKDIPFELKEEILAKGSIELELSEKELF